MPIRTRPRPSSRAVAALAVLAGAVAPLVAATPAPAAAAPAPVAVRWSATEVVAGTRLVATVPRASRPRGSRLVLQRRYLDGWRAADTTANKRDGRFVLRFPTDQFGAFKVRVVAKRKARVVGRSAATRLTVRPSWDPVGRAEQHAFLTRPVTRWDSCRPIRWTFNPRKAPATGLAQVKAGVDRVAAATGLDFVYVGKTDQKVTYHGSGVRGAKLIVGWRGPGYSPFSQPGTAAVGGHSYLEGYREADGTRVSRAITGGVALNAGMIGRLDDGYGAGHTWGEVIVHELGHVLGLAHTDAASQLMFFRTTDRRATWGAGDLAGLRRVGDVRGCLVRGTGRVDAEPRIRAFR